MMEPDPYRNAPLEPPKAPGLPVPWGTIAALFVLAPIAWGLLNHAYCALVFALPFPWALLAYRRRAGMTVGEQRKLARVLVGSGVFAVLFAAMLVQKYRADRLETAVIAEIRSFRAARGRYPTLSELEQFTGRTLRFGAGRDGVRYLDWSHNGEPNPTVVRVLVAPFGRRFTHVATGRVVYLD